MNEDINLDQFLGDEVRLSNFDQINTPSLFINTADDNICPFLDEIEQEIKKTEFCCMIKPSKGGHLGMWTLDLKHKWFEWSLEWFKTIEKIENK